MVAGGSAGVVLVVALGVVVVVAEALSGSDIGCEVHQSVHSHGAGIRLWPVPALSRSKEADMEKSDNSRSDAASRQPVRDPNLFGRSVAPFIFRYLEYYFADLGPAGFATVLEEVAVSLSCKAEVLRGGGVRE